MEWRMEQRKERTEVLPLFCRTTLFRNRLWWMEHNLPYKGCFPARISLPPRWEAPSHRPHKVLHLYHASAQKEPPCILWQIGSEIRAGKQPLYGRLCIWWCRQAWTGALRQSYLFIQLFFLHPLRMTKRIVMNRKCARLYSSGKICQLQKRLKWIIFGPPGIYIQNCEKYRFFGELKVSYPLAPF